MRNGDENADDIAGRFTGTYTGADARSCKYGTTSEITDKKRKGLPESGKGEALEIHHSPEKEPVSCLTDWLFLGALVHLQSLAFTALFFPDAAIYRSGELFRSP